MLHGERKAPQSESLMWLYRTSGDAEKPIVLYEYQLGQGAKHPREFLAGFQGYLHTDDYAGYHSLPEEITVVGCSNRSRMETVQTGQIYSGTTSKKGFSVHLSGRWGGLYGKGAILHLDGDTRRKSCAAGYCINSFPGQRYFG